MARSVGSPDVPAVKASKLLVRNQGKEIQSDPMTHFEGDHWGVRLTAYAMGLLSKTIISCMVGAGGLSLGLYAAWRMGLI